MLRNACKKERFIPMLSLKCCEKFRIKFEQFSDAFCQRINRRSDWIDWIFWGNCASHIAVFTLLFLFTFFPDNYINYYILFIKIVCFCRTLVFKNCMNLKMFCCFSRWISISGNGNGKEQNARIFFFFNCWICILHGLMVIFYVEHATHMNWTKKINRFRFRHGWEFATVSSNHCAMRNENANRVYFFLIYRFNLYFLLIFYSNLHHRFVFDFKNPWKKNKWN